MATTIDAASARLPAMTVLGEADFCTSLEWLPSLLIASVMRVNNR
jgi:hypothetical protein